MAESKLTMLDIAKMAGVGKSTVSRYFNGGYIKKETAEKIKAVIDKYHYEPNVIAQMLKAKKTNVIGIITPALDSITSSRMIMSMDEYLRNEGYVSYIINTNHDELRELKSIQNFSKLNVDGIILLATHLTMAHQKLFADLNIPIVLLGQSYKNNVSIIYDDYNAGYDIGKYVADHGHKNILVVGVNSKDEAVGVIRKQGIYDALNDMKIDDIQFVESTFSFDYTVSKISHYLDEHQLPTVIIASTDNQALVCYKVLISRGYKVPDDVSLIAFGGYEASELITPDLTTIRFENEEAGCCAAKAVIDLVEEKDVNNEIRIDYVFIEGHSVKNINKDYK